MTTPPSDRVLDEDKAFAYAWAQVAEFASLAARLARRASSEGDVDAGKKAAETLMFTQRMAAAAAGFGAGWSPERILSEVAATMERMQASELERHKQMLKTQRDALQVNWEQVEKLKKGVDGVLDNLHAVAEFCATLKEKS